MEAIGTEFLQKNDLSITDPIVCTKVTSCSHNVSKVLVATETGVIIGFWPRSDSDINNDSAIQQQVNWNVSSPVVQFIQLTQLPKEEQEDTEGCLAVLALTRDGTVWVIRIRCEPSSRLGIKRQKIETNSCERLFQNSALTHIQPCPEGFYGLLRNQSKIILYNLSTNQISSTLSIPAEFDVDRLLSSNVHGEDLDPLLRNQLGLPKQNGLLYCTSKGMIYCHDVLQEKDTFITEFPSEKPASVYFLRMKSSMQLNTMVILGQEGTIQLFIVSGERLIFQEFFVPGPINASALINNDMDDVLLASLKDNGQVYRIALLYKPSSSDFPGVSLQLIRLDCTNQVNQIHVKKKNTDGFIFELLKKDNTIVTIRTQLKKAEKKIKENTEETERAIQDILDELEQHEKEQKEVEAYTEKLNIKLASVNRTIYALQRIKSQKQKLQDNDEDNGNILSPFQCSVQPMVIPPSSRHYTGRASCALKLRVHTSMDLDWDKWYLHADISNQNTLLQEKVNNEMSRSSSTDGFTLLLPLVGLSDNHIWERDIPVDIERLSLPIHVNLHLSTQLDVDTISLSDQVNSRTTEGKQFMFHLSEVTLDDLHFITPCTDSVLKLLEKDGIYETSMQLENEYQSRKLLDNTNRYPLARFEARYVSKDDKLLLQPTVDKTEIRLEVIIKSEMTLEETYGKIISTFLKEGKTLEEMEKIMQNQEQAIFTLASFPQSPVIVSLSKEENHSSTSVSKLCLDRIFVILRIQCVHPVVLLKIEAALLSRLQYLFELADVQQQGTNQEKESEYYKQCRKVTKLASKLEEEFRVGGSQDEFWKTLEALVHQLRMLYNQINFGPVSIV